MKKIIIPFLCILLAVSTALNIRLLFLFEDALGDMYYYMSKSYFSNQLILTYIDDGQNDLAKDVINRHAQKYGAAVAVICMERGCEKAQQDAK